MSVADSINIRRKLSKRRSPSSTLTDVPKKRVTKSHESVPLFHSSPSSDENSDFDITQEMFQKFLQDLLNIKEDNWFTQRMKHYKEAGILGEAVLRRIKLEEEEIDEEIERNGLEIKHEAWKNKYLNKLHCDCACHLNIWHSLFINKIHNNRWLLECKKLKVTTDMTVLKDQTQGIQYIKVPMADANPWKQKADQVVRYVDFECGFDESCNLHLGYRQPKLRQIYLALLKSKVIGCIIAEPMSKAYYLVKKVGDAEFVDGQCEVKCGINRIWVNNGYRRRKVATVLFKIVQYIFVKNEILSEKDIALSTVTDDGLLFATAILKSRMIPIYTESPSWKNMEIPITNTKQEV